VGLDPGLDPAVVRVASFQTTEGGGVGHLAALYRRGSHDVVKHLVVDDSLDHLAGNEAPIEAGIHPDGLGLLRVRP